MDFDRLGLGQGPDQDLHAGIISTFFSVARSDILTLLVQSLVMYVALVWRYLKTKGLFPAAIHSPKRSSSVV